MFQLTQVLYAAYVCSMNRWKGLFINSLSHVAVSWKSIEMQISGTRCWRGRAGRRKYSASVSPAIYSTAIYMTKVGGGRGEGRWWAFIEWKEAGAQGNLTLPSSPFLQSSPLHEYTPHDLLVWQAFALYFSCISYEMKRSGEQGRLPFFLTPET